MKIFSIEFVALLLQKLGDCDFENGYTISAAFSSSANDLEHVVFAILEIWLNDPRVQILLQVLQYVMGYFERLVFMLTMQINEKVDRVFVVQKIEHLLLGHECRLGVASFHFSQLLHVIGKGFLVTLLSGKKGVDFDLPNLLLMELGFSSEFLVLVLELAIIIVVYPHEVTHGLRGEEWLLWDLLSTTLSYWANYVLATCWIKWHVGGLILLLFALSKHAIHLLLSHWIALCLEIRKSLTQNVHNQIRTSKSLNAISYHVAILLGNIWKLSQNYLFKVIQAWIVALPLSHFLLKFY